MPLPPIAPLDLRLERAASRARRLLGGSGASGPAKSTESDGARRGLPDDADARAIARRLRTAASTSAGGQSEQEAWALAQTLVEHAKAAMTKLLNGSVDGALGAQEALALESVMQVRGRPALRLEADGLEGLDPHKHPGSDTWRALLDDHAATLVQVASATGAVRVRDSGSQQTWVQGSAWLAGRPDKTCVLTNRHVLFPTMGAALASRNPGAATTARLTPSLDVTIDLAFDNGAARQQVLKAVEVLYVAEDSDPVDVAVIRVVPPAGFVLPAPLALASKRFEDSRLYVVGHPSRLDSALVTDEIQAVFGSPDDRKRISLGEVMEADPKRPSDLLHDASTIGGYSGGCVLGFLTREVAGLHYYGDPETGNRAVHSAELRSHPVARFL